MKVAATASLVVATAVFVVFRVVGEHGWRGYVATAAEAAMVGGLADWFAVTALFRRPLGLPIPHTAIVPTRKDQIGASLGAFVEENFLDGDTLADRVAAMEVADRLARWLDDDANVAAVAARLADGLVALSELADDDAVQDAIGGFVRDRMRRTSAAPVLARAIDAAVDSGQDQAALDSVLAGVVRTIDDNAELFRRRVHDESPWWVPAAVDDRVFARLVAGLHALVDDVAGDPHHELRRHLRRRLGDLAERLRDDPALAARVDGVRDQLLERPELGRWLDRLWSELEADLAAAADDPASGLRRRLDAALTSVGVRLRDDAELRARVDGYAIRAARYAADASGDEVADLISTTVARWDADDTSRRIELLVGRDLQFIRINGTVVGAIAGVAIHAVGQAIG